MIKRILEFIIIVIIMGYMKFISRVDECYESIEKFYNDISENSINYLDEYLFFKL